MTVAYHSMKHQVTREQPHTSAKHTEHTHLNHFAWKLLASNRGNVNVSKIPIPG